MTERRCLRSASTRRRRHARQFVVIERGQAGEDGAGIGGDGEGRRIKSGERRDMLDARGLRMMSVACFTTASVRSSEAPGGSCNDRDQIALILFGDEAGRRARELQAGQGDKTDIER